MSIRGETGGSLAISAGTTARSICLPVATALLLVATLLLLAPPVAAQDTVTVDASSSLDGGQSSTFTVAHTTGTGDDRMLIVAVSLLNKDVNKEVGNVTYGGTPMTQIANVAEGKRIQLYRLKAPATGTADVVVTIEGTQANKAAIGVVSLEGVSQSDPDDATVSTAGQQATSSLTVASETGDLVMDVLATEKTITGPGAGQTLRWKAAAEPGKESAGSTEPGADSVDMSWDFESSAFIHIAFNINAADTTPPSVTNASLDDATDGDGVVADGDIVNVSADVQDAVGVGSVMADASAFGAGTVNLTDGDGDGTYDAAFTVAAAAAAADGDHALTVNATDTSGNVGSDTTNALTLDTTAPAITAAQLVDRTDGDGAVAGGDTVEVRATVTDATALTVTGNLSRFGAGTVTMTDPDGDDVYNATATVAAAGTVDGDFAATVEATDAANITATASTGLLTLDTTPPSVATATLTDTTDGDGVVNDGDTVEITAQVTDATALTVTANASRFGAGTVTLADPDGDDVYDGAVTVNAAAADPDGALNVTVTATDAVGLSTVVNTDTLTLDTTAPTLTNSQMIDRSDGDGIVTGGDLVEVRVDVADATSTALTANVSDFGVGDVTLTDPDGDGTYNISFTVDTNQASPDGDYPAEITATDQGGNLASATTNTLTLDRSPPPGPGDPHVRDPTLVDATDGNGVVNGGDDLTVSSNVTDDVGIATVEADGSPFGAGTVAMSDGDGDGIYDATFAVSVAGTVDGAFGVVVNATDTDGNVTSNVTNTVTLDTTPPVVEDATISDTDDVVGDGETVHVAAAVTDATDVAVTADASLFGGGTVSLTDPDGNGVYNGTFTTDAAASSDGDHAVTVDATDGGGNTGSNTSGTLTFDTTAAALTNATLIDLDDGDGVVGDADPVTVAADVADATNVSVTADASAFGVGTVVMLDPDGDGTYVANASVNASAAAADGSYALTVDATDLGGNTGSTTTNALALDTSSPSLTNVDLRDDGDGDAVVAPGGTLAVSALVTDANGVPSVTADAAAFGAGTVTLTDGDGDDVYDATFAADAGTPDGQLRVTVTATDVADNAATAQSNDVTVDGTAPAVIDAAMTDLAPIDGFVADGEDIAVSVTATDATALTVEADLSPFGAGTDELTDTDDDDTYTATFTADGAAASPDGLYDANVTATDAAGNLNVTTTNALTLDATPPTVADATLTDATDGDGTVEEGDTVSVASTVTDANALGQVAADASPFGAAAVFMNDSDGDDVYDGNFTVGDADAGDRSVTVNATDVPGNDASAETNALTLAGAVSGAAGGLGGDGGGSSRDPGRGPLAVDVRPVGGRTIGIAVENPRSDERTPVNTYAADLVTDDLVKLHLLEFQVTERGDLDLTVRADRRPSEGPPAPGSSIGSSETLLYLTVTHDRPATRFEQGRIVFSVTERALDERGASDDDVVLARYTDRWRTLPTEHRSFRDGRHTYVSTSPGLSTFAVVLAPSSNDERDLPAGGGPPDTEATRDGDDAGPPADGAPQEPAPGGIPTAPLAVGAVLLALVAVFVARSIRRRPRR